MNNQVNKSSSDELDEKRVAYLCSLAILDTGDDENLDRIVDVCRHVFGMPVSYIALIDEDRQWFKSVRGLELREIDREDSFCTVTIESDEVMEVTDATKHPRFAQNPFVTGKPNIRYYLGAPISISGYRVGTLCAVDFEAREPATVEEKEIISDLAKIVAREIYVQHLIRETIPIVVKAATDGE